MYSAEHPDTLHDYYRLKAIDHGGRQAIEDQAMNAMYEALDRGESREEAEKIFFSFFNKQSHAI